MSNKPSMMGGDGQLQSNNPNINVTIDGTSYLINTHQIPYFENLANFQNNADSELVHGSIPYLDVALAGIQNGYRHCFRKIPADLEAFRGVCETLDFLCVDVLQGHSLVDIIKNLKAGKGDYEVDYKRPVFVKGNKSIARDAAFVFAYQVLIGTFQNEHKDSMQVFNAVKYVVSHRATFKFVTQKLVRAAYEERFTISVKQTMDLNRWRIEDRGQEEVTTEESSSSHYDSDC